VSIFEDNSSEDEPWIQEHKRLFQTPKKRLPPPLQMSGAKTQCPNCQGTTPMESIRAGKCLACQVADYLGPIH